MQRNCSLLTLAILTLVTLLSGCSWFEKSSPPKATLASDSESTNAEGSATIAGQETIATRRTSDAIEIRWLVPGEAVEEYLLHYGTAKDALTNEVTIPVTELKKIQHPVLGPLFVYLLKPVPRDQTIFLSLQAKNKYGTSAPTDSIAVEP